VRKKFLLVALIVSCSILAWSLGRGKVEPVKAGGATLDPAGESRGYALLYQFRAQQGGSTLAVDSGLADRARAWALNMAQQKKLYHSDFPPCSNCYRGENVGYGGSVDAVETAFENSPHHRENELNPRFSLVGIGVAVDDSGLTWVAQEFSQGAPTPPSTSTTSLAPATRPPVATTTTTRCGV
jgi:hypothetical protein